MDDDEKIGYNRDPTTNNMFKSKKNKAPVAEPTKNTNGKNMETPQENGTSTVVQVSFSKNPYFYAKFGQKLLIGSKNEPGKDQIIISGLGTAAKNAIASATIMDKEKCATISKIETSCHWNEKFHKSIPKISIVLKKNPDYVAETA